MLSYALPLETRDGLNIRPARRTSAGCSIPVVLPAFAGHVVHSIPGNEGGRTDSLSYALPSGTRDDLNIRHTDRKPADCSTCSPAGICRGSPLQWRREWTKPDGPAHARERLPRRSRTCQTIQRWCCSFVRHSPLQFTSNRQSPGYFPQVLHGGRRRRSRLRTHNSIRGAPVSFRAFALVIMATSDKETSANRMGT